MPKSGSGKPQPEGSERSSKLRPGKVRRTNTSARPLTGSARALFRLVRQVSRTPPANRNSSGRVSPASRATGSAFKQRAIINVRYSNGNPKSGVKAKVSWKAHGKYVERESATRVVVPSPDEVTAEATGHRVPEGRLGLATQRPLDSLLEEWQAQGDPRIYKIIISPESQDADLGLAAQAVIARIEQHAAQPVEWAGIVHTNTDNRHAHIVVRSRLPSGAVLHLPKAVIKIELRSAAEQQLTKQLGPRTLEDLKRQQTMELTANRVTPLDRMINKSADKLNEEGETRRVVGSREFIQVGRNPSVLQHARLTHLEKLGLAVNDAAHGWLIVPNLLPQLQKVKDLQDRARTLFASGVAISDSHAPMEFTTNSRKLIGRVLLNSENDLTGALQTAFETLDGKIVFVEHDTPLRAAWKRGDLAPGNIVTIDSLRSDPTRLYASSAGKDVDVLSDSKTLDSLNRRMQSMGIDEVKVDKGWLGDFRRSIQARSIHRDRSKGY